MKYIFILIIAFGLSNPLHAQEILIDFEARFQSEVNTGKAWNSNYQKIKSPLSIKYADGKLTMLDEKGKEYWSADIIRAYETKRSSDRKYYTLEYKDQENGLIGYILYEEYNELGEMTYELQTPIIDETGKVLGYAYYSSDS